MPLIRETLVVTRSATGHGHIAPMGAQTVTLTDGRPGVLLQPFRPSATLENLLHGRCATLNHVDDVRIIAGCLTGRREWPLVVANRIACGRLAVALAHVELELDHVEDEPKRPRLFLRAVHEANHAPFPGFNRAKAAVIEAAILVSRLHMLTAEKIDAEVEYLRIAIDKTAGDQELEAWGWLMAAVDAHRQNASRRGEGK
jgi:uncharacterized protein